MSLPLHHPLNSPYPPEPIRMKGCLFGLLFVAILGVGGCVAIMASDSDKPSSPVTVETITIVDTPPPHLN